MVGAKVGDKVYVRIGDRSSQQWFGTIHSLDEYGRAFILNESGIGGGLVGKGRWRHLNEKEYFEAKLTDGTYVDRMEPNIVIEWNKFQENLRK